MEGVFEKGKDFLGKIPRSLYLPLALGCIGVILFVYGIWNTVALNASRENSNPNNISHTSTGSAQLPQKTQVMGVTTNTIKVDIEGAVVSPGVYTLAKDARIQDGLIACGGLSASADREYVAKHIDLASKFTDGAKLYIPKLGEMDVKSISQSDSSVISGTDSVNNLVSINTASANDLDNLPGVGPATAQKIISNRPYEVLEELMTKKAVTQKVFDKIKDQISL